MNYKDNNDYELMYLISDSNEYAYDILFKKYESLIDIVCNHFFYYFKEHNITYDELKQEGRIGLYNAINKYDETKDIKFYTFALLCIKQSIIQCYVINNRIKNKIVYDAKPLDDDSYFTKYDPYFNIEENEYSNEIINFKNSLDFIDANIFELRFSGFKYEDISSLLDITKKAVDNRLLKIKIKLKKYMLNKKIVL